MQSPEDEPQDLLEEIVPQPRARAPRAATPPWGTAIAFVLCGVGAFLAIQLLRADRHRPSAAPEKRAERSPSRRLEAARESGPRTVPSAPAEAAWPATVPAPSRPTGPETPRPAAARSAPEAAPSAGPGQPTPSPPTGPPLDKKDLYLFALEADRTAARAAFAEAAGQLRALLPRSTSPEVSEEFRGRIEDLDRLAAIVERIAAAVPGTVGDVTLGGSARLAATAADRDGITVLRGAKPEKLRWADLDVPAFLALVARTDQGVEGLIGQALYCFERKEPWEERGHKLLQQALEADPSRVREINAILSRKLGLPAPAGGFTFFRDRFMTPEKAEAFRGRERSRALLGQARSPRKEVRTEAFRELPTLGAEALDGFLGFLAKRRAELLKQLATLKTTRALAQLQKEKAQFVEARDRLLKRIFDEKNYPYPYRPPEASAEAYQLYIESQKVIDAETRDLKKVWEGKRPPVELTPDFIEAFELWSEVAAAQREFHQESPPEEPEPLLMAFAPLDFYVSHGRKVVLPLCPLDPKERDLIGYNQQVLDWNAQLTTEATPAEVQQVEITNRYRVMMGRRAVMLSERLWRTARGHSEEMSRLGYFAHQSPVPGRMSPIDRARQEGYNGDVSENIHGGRSGPESAFEGWRHSSGHHRNMLGAHWLEMGSAFAGNRWTQNFGSRQITLRQILAGQDPTPPPSPRAAPPEDGPGR